MYALKCSMNKLTTLPRGFGAFPVLEVLDLTYNNLTEESLPGNFFMIGILHYFIYVMQIDHLISFKQKHWELSIWEIMILPSFPLKLVNWRIFKL